MRRVLLPLVILLAGVVTVKAGTPVARVLFIGDSMTGWLSERLEAYGAVNDFEVSTVIWDGSTLTKWVNTGKIPGLVAKYKPDVVMVCLGLNELLVRDPEARMSVPLSKFGKQLGTLPYVWIGPPTWPGKGTGEVFNRWMSSHLPGRGHYFSSEKLQLARQSRTNPHPTRTACARWMDDVVKWLPTAGVGFSDDLKIPSLSAMKRGKVYIYRRMKQPL